MSAPPFKQRAIQAHNAEFTYRLLATTRQICASQAVAAC